MRNVFNARCASKRTHKHCALSTRGTCDIKFAFAITIFRARLVRVCVFVFRTPQQRPGTVGPLVCACMLARARALHMRETPKRFCELRSPLAVNAQLPRHAVRGPCIKIARNQFAMPPAPPTGAVYVCASAQVDAIKNKQYAHMRALVRRRAKHDVRVRAICVRDYGGGSEFAFAFASGWTNQSMPPALSGLRSIAVPVNQI